MPVSMDPNDPINQATRGASGSAAALVPTIGGTPTGMAANAAATTPPGVTPSTPWAGDPNAGMAPLSGWAGAQGYTPAQLSTLYENPWYVLPDVFPGMSTMSPLYQSLRDIGADPLALYNIMQGSQGLLQQDATGDFANWLQSLYKNLGTPGGRGIDAGSLIRSIFGAGEQTSLGQILGAGDMGTQVRTLFNLLRDASNAGMNPLASRGYQAAVSRAGDEYGNAQLKAGSEDSQTFQQWANANAPWLTGR